MAVLNVIGSFASIAALFWMAYDKFFTKKNKPNDNTNGIYISINVGPEKIIQYYLGSTHKNKEAFIKQFTDEVTHFAQSEKALKNYKDTMWELNSSGLWVKRK
jgi:hypothetical protein